MSDPESERAIYEHFKRLGCFDPAKETKELIEDVPALRNQGADPGQPAAGLRKEMAKVIDLCTVSGLIPANEDGPDRIGYMVGRKDDGKSGLYTTPERAFSKAFPALAALSAPSQGPAEPISVHVTCDPKASPELQRALGAAIAGAIEVAKEKNAAHPIPPAAGLEQLIRAGVMLSNCAFNLKQWTSLEPDTKRSLEECQKRWDLALRVFREAPTDKNSLTVPPVPAAPAASVDLPTAPHHGEAARIYSAIRTTGEPIESAPLANRVARDLFAYAYDLESRLATHPGSASTGEVNHG